MSNNKKSSVAFSREGKGCFSIESLEDIKVDSLSLNDWQKIAYLALLSRTLDELEEKLLAPQKKVLYQFSAKGHELVQLLVGYHLTHPYDGVGVYYRSRPLMLSLGVPPEDLLASNMGKSGGFSNGRDIGVVFNYHQKGKPTVLPSAGEVGSQFTPSAGWAQSVLYYRYVLKNKDYEKAIAVVLAGDGAVATNGFWAALVMATTQSLPLLFIIEDNSYGISVPSNFQTPDGNIINNLRAFKNLNIFQYNDDDYIGVSKVISLAFSYVRSHKGPAILRVKVPRLSGHSFQDNQIYKPVELLEKEKKEDPLIWLRQFLMEQKKSDQWWQQEHIRVKKIVFEALEKAQNRASPKPKNVLKYVYEQSFIKKSTPVFSSRQRISMAESIRRTLIDELKRNKKLLLFGEDIGKKGGVHGVTMDLQNSFGKERVFDTSLSEEGIVGRAVGMAIAGLLPVAEIQFRKYSDPAMEQINNCGTIRWRTANRFSAPLVIRMPGGFAKVGDPWHSMCGEAIFAHAIGWQIVFPRNAMTAAGLLRSALRSPNPTIFFEHRYLLNARYARTPYPNSEYIIPFGNAEVIRKGDDLTVITWGAMCERCEEAANQINKSIEIIDLCTIKPWDQEKVLQSIKKTGRCLVVHEDNITVGLGAEIVAIVSEYIFDYLEAPIKRIATPDVPIPYNIDLMNAVIPTIERIKKAMEELISY